MSEIAAQVRAALADRYRIERELGTGGMATVYLARDLKHESIGFVALGVATAVAVATGFAGTIGNAVTGIAFLATAGAGVIANGVLRLPRWARLRGRQMEGLAVEAALRPGPTFPRQDDEH